MTTAVPEQEHGASSDVLTERKFNNHKEALSFYNIAKGRLLHIADWTELCGTKATEFTLTDKFGTAKNDIATVGDFISIDIPGPGNKAGKGCDWVCIEEIAETGTESDEEQRCFIRVRPASNPTITSEETTHFFKDEATSTFMVTRIGKTITAEVHGRNEVPNTDANKLIDKVRNTLVGLGSMIGISNIQWKALTKGIIKH